MKALPGSRVSEIFSKSRVFRTQNLLIRRSISEYTHNRGGIAVIVPKKIVAKSYQRNRVKRWIKSIVDQHTSKDSMVYDWVIVITHYDSYRGYYQDLQRIYSTIN